MAFLSGILEYTFLQKAILACVLSGVTCGIIGTYIVARRMVFLCGGITHASFGGIGLALYLGAENPIFGAIAFAILSALGIEWSSSRSKIRQDTAIGAIWGAGMAIGALFMSLRPGYASRDMSSFLFGNIFSIPDGDLIALAVLAVVLLVAGAIWHRQIMYVAFDKEFARSLGIKVELISSIMAVVAAITIVLSIRVMGIILLISLLTMPVVGANMLSKSYTKIVPIAILLAVVGGVLGVAFSYEVGCYLPNVNIPSGPAIIFVLVIAILIIKLLSLWINKIRGRRN